MVTAYDPFILSEQHTDSEITVDGNNLLFGHGPRPRAFRVTEAGEGRKRPFFFLSFVNFFSRQKIPRAPRQKEGRRWAGEGRGASRQAAQHEVGRRAEEARGKEGRRRDSCFDSGGKWMKREGKRRVIPCGPMLVLMFQFA